MDSASVPTDIHAFCESARNLVDTLGPYVVESFELRAVGLPEGNPGPQELMESLRLIRTRVDRLEAILATAVRIRGRAGRAHEAARAVATDAWNTASRATRTGQQRQNTDFIAPRERYADADLATLEERREERNAREVLSVAEESLEVIRIAHRGLDGLRRDLDALLQAQRVERSVER